MFDPVILHSLMVTIAVLIGVGCVLSGIAWFSIWRDQGQ